MSDATYLYGECPQIDQYAGIELRGHKHNNAYICLGLISEWLFSGLSFIYKLKYLCTLPSITFYLVRG